MSIVNISDKSTMRGKRLRNLALELFKTLNKMNPEYMKERFPKTTLETRRGLSVSTRRGLRVETRRPLNLEINKNYTTRYGNKSLPCLGPHIWKPLPNQN